MAHSIATKQNFKMRIVILITFLVVVAQALAAPQSGNDHTDHPQEAHKRFILEIISAILAPWINKPPQHNIEPVEISNESSSSESSAESESSSEQSSEESNMEVSEEVDGSDESDDSVEDEEDENNNDVAATEEPEEDADNEEANDENELASEEPEDSADEQGNDDEEIIYEEPVENTEEESDDNAAPKARFYSPILNAASDAQGTSGNSKFNKQRFNKI